MAQDRSARSAHTAEPLAGGMELYVLPIVSPSNPRLSGGGAVPCGDFVCDLRTVDSWQFYHLWRPPERSTPELPIALSALRPQTRAMLDAATPLLGGAPAYVIVHIPRLELPPLGKQLPGEEKARLDAMVATRAVLDDLDPVRPGEPRGYFIHYDTTLRRKGYLAVGGRAAVLLGLAGESFATLASLLQAGALDPAGGFTLEGLNNAMVRVSLWSANQDIYESVHEVRELRRSGDDSTRGQIGVSFALAFIGTALALVSYLPQPIELAPGLFFLALSGLVYALHAQHGDRLSRRAGFLLLLIGIVLVAAGAAFGILRVPLPTLPPLKLPFGIATPDASASACW